MAMKYATLDKLITPRPKSANLAVMDHSRRRLPDDGKPPTSQIKYPTLNKDESEFEPYEYNPEVNPLFFDILFSMGFE